MLYYTVSHLRRSDLYFISVTTAMSSLYTTSPSSASDMPILKYYHLLPKTFDTRSQYRLGGGIYEGLLLTDRYKGENIVSHKGPGVII